jgi:uncharacterized protein YuzE
MKVVYDQAADTLTSIFTEMPIAESDEDKPGVILDYDDKGNLVSLEILDASQRVTVPGKVDVVLLEHKNEFAALLKLARKQARKARLKPADHIWGSLAA